MQELGLVDVQTIDINRRDRPELKPITDKAFNAALGAVLMAAFKIRNVQSGGTPEDAIKEAGALVKRVEELCGEGMEWHVPASTILARAGR
jgi:hypothetical protein